MLILKHAINDKNFFATKMSVWVEVSTRRPADHLNSTLPSTFSVFGDPRLNEINGLRWFLC